jgi:uncharacterized protein
MQKYLIDAGPIIALFDRDDRYHNQIKDFLCRLEGRLVTTWAVVTEVMYMLDFNIHVQMDFLQWIRRNALNIAIMSGNEIIRVIELMEKYSYVPMDFADATLMAISESDKINEIITIDSDFHIYRNIKNKVLQNIFIPDENA